MRILLVSACLPSHHHALVPIGWAAAAAGHEVRLAVTPDLAAAAALSGLPVVPVGPPVDFAGLHADLLRRVQEEGAAYDPKLVFCDVADLMADDLLALARSWRPDTVVWDPSALAGPLAAEAVGARSVRCLWGPDMLGRGATLTERLPGRFPALFERYGVPFDADPDWLTLDPTPPQTWGATAGPRRAVRYVPYGAVGTPPPWVFDRPERPRVLMTFGLSSAVREFAGDGGLASSPALRAVLGPDVEVVVAALPEDRAALGDLPDRVRVAIGCPLPSLLPSCAAVVHHGGSGTLLSAALAGVPQLILSYRPDLHYAGQQFSPTGAVGHLMPDQASAEAIAAEVARCVSDPGRRAAADRLRASMLDLPLPGALLTEAVPA
jgi:UDP:flavonoid glycosyltransferase YjiC (YdhE family)